MNKTILITGGLGFLGRSVANKFKKLGYRVVGIGHGQFSTGEAPTSGFDFWLDASITVSNLMMLDECFDLVVHCAGNASVGHSIENPLLDFTKTVQGTIELLEFLRLTKSGALLIYPSSAGVYGSKEDAPIKEDSSLNPVSPYGIINVLQRSYSNLTQRITALDPQ